ncbi:MAG: hypothetical protein PHN44_05735 [Candidatus Marinimicrobia bacterium]|nr:hypothetical protein [Candidatus Neomarinimicrobiota bacterium]
MNCPYEPKIKDESSSVEVNNPHYDDWTAGYNARSLELEIVIKGLNELARELDEGRMELLKKKETIELGENLRDIQRYRESGAES